MFVSNWASRNYFRQFLSAIDVVGTFAPGCSSAIGLDGTIFVNSCQQLAKIVPWPTIADEHSPEIGEKELIGGVFRVGSALNPVFED